MDEVGSAILRHDLSDTATEDEKAAVAASTNACVGPLVVLTSDGNAYSVMWLTKDVDANDVIVRTLQRNALTVSSSPVLLCISFAYRACVCSSLYSHAVFTFVSVARSRRPPEELALKPVDPEIAAAMEQQQQQQQAPPQGAPAPAAE